jgi:diguanylate cyclase (GGDEF)-like protein
MKILVAHTDDLTRGMLESVLARWGHEVVLAENGSAALEKLKAQGGPSLAILDRNLSGLDGLQICREIRQSAAATYVYLVLVIAKGEEQAIVEGLQAGADDFLAAPLSTDDLMVRLRIARRILELQEELHRAQEAINYQTTHDALTGLANRAGVIDTLRREVARVRREGSPMALILTEVDDLKAVNEKYGHAAGDAVLREAARRIRSVVRPYDTVGRYGGEEFLVVAPGCDAKAALTQADRLRAAVAQGGMDLSEWGKFAVPTDGRLRITLSLGVASGDKIAAEQHILRAAEVALNRAKKAGRDRVETAQEADFS